MSGPDCRHSQRGSRSTLRGSRHGRGRGRCPLPIGWKATSAGWEAADAARGGSCAGRLWAMFSPAAETRLVDRPRARWPVSSSKVAFGLFFGGVSPPQVKETPAAAGSFVLRRKSDELFGGDSHHGLERIAPVRIYVGRFAPPRAGSCMPPSLWWSAVKRSVFSVVKRESDGK
jgi:hypothetical protein